MKLTADGNVTRAGWGIRKIALNKGVDRLDLNRPGRTGWGGNSGFHCLNLAVQMQPAKILLVGYDMTLANGIHWHGRHPSGLNNPSAPNVERWRRVVDGAAEQIEALGIRVINCSTVSALENYERMTFEEALSC